MYEYSCTDVPYSGCSGNGFVIGDAGYYNIICFPFADGKVYSSYNGGSWKRIS